MSIARVDGFQKHKTTIENCVEQKQKNAFAWKKIFWKVVFQTLCTKIEGIVLSENTMSSRE